VVNDGKSNGGMVAAEEREPKLHKVLVAGGIRTVAGSEGRVELVDVIWLGEAMVSVS
jgi:hypothetical protein